MPTSFASFRWGRWLSAVLLLIALLGAAYVWAVLNWNYAEGERAGFVQKLSRKGWICKTWEGELAIINMPGTLTEKFTFTVHDEKLVTAINNSLGRKVTLYYEQHVGVPTSCFGDTMYYITRVRTVD
ncbi:hypothetical protein FNU76_15215 [Chitinimonas arctica]|uniref:6-phosphogluconate dehydrogenase n=1 Tax=Chitinimonas arctica TaxID=2594795 RepID=A0A516SHJ4_9NEIS|nr:hypothetical protein [Chitinimonas arctica]QDQ27595.1 hypothetical protein FNU76_15215 [Chitinimonas arctica]